jgi:hypothetical protein
MEEQTLDFIENNQMMNNVLSSFYQMELGREGDLLARFYDVIKHRMIGKPDLYGEDDYARYLESCNMINDYINESNE